MMPDFHLYQRYTFEEALAILCNGTTPELFWDGDFALLDGAVLAFFTNGDPDSGTQFPSPKRAVWRPKRQLQVHSHVLQPFSDIRYYHLFGRAAGDTTYIYLGEAFCGSYGVAGGDYSANFTLKIGLPREFWLGIGGSLHHDPLEYLRSNDGLKAELRYHQRTFELLHLTPHLDVAAIERLNRIEREHQIHIPTAIREWYSLAESMDLLRQFAQIHSPIDLSTDWEPGQAGIQYSVPGFDALTVAPMVENQGVWHMATPFIDDDPPVIFGDDMDAYFDWHFHAEHFSDFIEAWAWDYLGFNRDYSYSGKQLTDDDISLIQKTFQPGPITYGGNMWYRCDVFQRYYREDQRVTLCAMDGSLGFDVELFAEHIDSLKTLLRGPWAAGDLLEVAGKIDLEMQKWYLKW